MKATITKAQLKAATDAASKDPSRSSCQMVRIEPGRMVATDGHRLYLVPIESTTADHQNETLHIGRNEAVRILKMMPGKSVAAIESDDEGTMRLTIDGRPCGEIARLDYEPNFPDYAKVMPQGEPTLTIGVSANHLKELCEAAIALSPRGRGVLRFDFRDPLSAFSVACGPSDNGGESNMVAVVMPLRL